MDATINSNNEPQQVSSENSGKSELMLFFESQISDVYWAYKDLLKAIREVKD